MRLKEKVTIITGAGQGIGRAYALKFAAEGAHIVVADLREDNAQNVIREVHALGAKGIAIRVDVSNPESIHAMVTRTVEEFGHVDVLLNNASIFSTIKMKPFEEISLQEWEQLMRVNVTGTFLCCQAVAPHMRARKQGCIINISSSAVLMGRPGYAHYIASKSAILGLTRALSRELGSDNITVNSIMPGATTTEVPRETVSSQQAQAMIDSRAIHRQQTPEDLVGAAVFLATEESSFITGQTINIDGGLTFL